VAEAGFDAGLEVLGFTSQANFLLNCGIGDLLAASKVGAATRRPQGIRPRRPAQARTICAHAAR
jgi:SAM-dependent MidA family methyltransferase